MVLTDVQQVACHELLRVIFRCYNNVLDEDRGLKTEMIALAEVYLFCTVAAAAPREEPIFQVISLLERCLIFLSADIAYRPS
jgi:hypothetical protein